MLVKWTPLYLLSVHRNIRVIGSERAMVGTIQFRRRGRFEYGPLQEEVEDEFVLSFRRMKSLSPYIKGKVDGGSTNWRG